MSRDPARDKPSASAAPTGAGPMKVRLPRGFNPNPIFESFSFRRASAPRKAKGFSFLQIGTDQLIDIRGKSQTEVLSTLLGESLEFRIHGDSR
jgi:hypothetical protein